MDRKYQNLISNIANGRSRYERERRYKEYDEIADWIKDWIPWNEAKTNGHHYLHASEANMYSIRFIISRWRDDCHPTLLGFCWARWSQTKQVDLSLAWDYPILFFVIVAFTWHSFSLSLPRISMVDDNVNHSLLSSNLAERKLSTTTSFTCTTR